MKKIKGRNIAHNYTKGYVSKVLGYARTYAADDTRLALNSELDNRKTQNLPRSEKQIAQQQAVAMAILLNPAGQNNDWRDYLKAADQFLDPANADDLQTSYELAQDTYHDDANLYLVDRRYQAGERALLADHAPQSRSANLLKKQAKFRAAFLAKIN